MNIPVIAGNLPSGFCPANYQQMLNGFTAAQSVNIETAGRRIVIGAATPNPEDNDAIWLRLPYGRFYFFDQVWRSLHPMIPGSTIWWFDAEPTFTSFDGGSAGAVSDITGPMWQKAKDIHGAEITARFPVTAGTLPSTAVLAVGGTGGEEKHSLTLIELPKVDCDVKVGTLDTKVMNATGSGSDGITYNTQAEGVAAGNLTVTLPGGLADGTAQGHNNMPPYAVGYLLQRTTRLFYTV